MCRLWPPLRSGANWSGVCRFDGGTVRGDAYQLRGDGMAGVVARRPGPSRLFLSAWFGCGRPLPRLILALAKIGTQGFRLTLHPILLGVVARLGVWLAWRRRRFGRRAVHGVKIGLGVVPSSGPNGIGGWSGTSSRRGPTGFAVGWLNVACAQAATTVIPRGPQTSGAAVAQW